VTMSMTGVCLKQVTGCVSRRILSVTRRHHLAIQPNRCLFFESDFKSGYSSKKLKRPTLAGLKEEVKDLGPELGKLKQEWIRKMRCDEVWDQQHGDYEVVWRFNDKDTINSWIVTRDHDHDEGNSKAEFTLGANKKGIFRGVLDTNVPKDGIIKESGFCNISSQRHKAITL